MTTKVAEAEFLPLKLANKAPAARGKSQNLFYEINLKQFIIVPLQHYHLRCWATNGWSGDWGKDTWCRNNCYHNPSFCPKFTSDGGGCDCNCHEGDHGCPRKSR